jgi:protein-S-isoprenylcysteine O-methyltransferase Ste14
MSSPSALPPPFLKVADFCERYLFSLLYLWLAWRAGERVWAIYLGMGTPAGGSFDFVALVRELDLLLVQLLIGVLLLRSHHAAEPPRHWRDVFLPLAVSLFFITYSFVAWLPAPLRTSLAPPEIQRVCAVASLPIGLLGSVLALWGVVSLGRSFGIYVAVRKVVLVGPYQHVRHPIYSGYVLVWVGLILANLSVAIILLVLLHTVLMVWRARLEEERLAEASAEYRAYRERTGFLLPRLDEAEPAED